MKSLVFYCLIVLFSCNACKQSQKESKALIPVLNQLKFSSFGAKITEAHAMSSQQMFAKFEDMTVGDTINVKFASRVKEVCSKKGCWMKLSLDDNSEAMVRFKDYGFFMPLDATDREVIIEGKAFVQETSIEELKHYAEDAGKSKDEIAKIIATKKEFAFEANGVLMNK